MNEQQVRSSLKDKPGLFYGYIIVIATFFITMIVFGVRQTYGIFFNPMASQFGWDSAVVSSVFSLSIIMEGTFGMIMGKLNDKYGPRIILTVCGLFLGSGYFLMSTVTALWQMYLFYGVFVGIGMGGMVVTILTTISRWFVTRRALMSGIAVSGTGIGSLIMSPLAERIISGYDWRTAYIIMSIIMLIIVVAAAQFLKRDPAVIGLSAYLKSTAGQIKSKLGNVNFTLSQAVHTRQFWLMLFILFFYGYVGYTIVVHVVPHIINQGISPAIAASFIAIFGASGIVSRVLMGAIGDKIGNKQVYIVTFVIYSITLTTMIFFKEIWFFYIVAALFGIASGGIQSTQAPYIAELFGLKSHGEIFGIIGFASTIGGAIGPLIGGYVFDITGQYQIAFLICSLIGLAALVCTVLIKPMRAAS